MALSSLFYKNTNAGNEENAGLLANQHDHHAEADYSNFDPFAAANGNYVGPVTTPVPEWMEENFSDEEEEDFQIYKGMKKGEEKKGINAGVPLWVILWILTLVILALVVGHPIVACLFRYVKKAKAKRIKKAAKLRRKELIRLHESAAAAAAAEVNVVNGAGSTKNVSFGTKVNYKCPDGTTGTHSLNPKEEDGRRGTRAGLALTDSGSEDASTAGPPSAEEEVKRASSNRDVAEYVPIGSVMHTQDSSIGQHRGVANMSETLEPSSKTAENHEVSSFLGQPVARHEDDILEKIRIAEEMNRQLDKQIAHEQKLTQDIKRKFNKSRKKTTSSSKSKSKGSRES